MTSRFIVFNEEKGLGLVIFRLGTAHQPQSFSAILLVRLEKHTKTARVSDKDM